jgi:uncharacterized protein YxjI
MGPGRRHESMESILAKTKAVVIRQVKEWGEILVGFEARNRFEILDEAGRPIGKAAEEAGGLSAILLRNFLGRCRPSTIHIYDLEGKEVATGRKPFRLYFHRMELFEGEKRVGAIQRKFSIFHRLFALEDASGTEVLRIKSPWLRIWTFKLLADDKEVGRISKRWGGVLKEMFSDADTFGVEFTHPSLPLSVKELLVVGVFLIDFTCFENNVRN